MNKEAPLVSIIVPVYKCEKYIEQCIKSIVNQSYKNIEIILILDGVFDNSENICNSFQNKDSRITIIKKENEGVSVARNVGINYSNGDWITFVDSDDWLCPNYVETLLFTALSSNSDIVLCDFILEAESTPKNCSFLNICEGEVPFSYQNDLILSCIVSTSLTLSKGVTNIGVPWGKLYKAKFLKDGNLSFVPGLKRMQDTIFNLYSFKYAKRIYYTKKFLYHYRKNENASTVKYMPDFDNIIEMFLQEVDRFYRIANIKEIQPAISDRTIILIIEMIRQKFISPHCKMNLFQKIVKISEIIYDKKRIFKNKINCSSGKYLTFKEKIIMHFLKTHIPFIAYLYALKQSLNLNKRISK